jgi:hypothetical protein
MGINEPDPLRAITVGQCHLFVRKAAQRREATLNLETADRSAGIAALSGGGREIPDRTHSDVDY